MAAQQELTASLQFSDRASNGHEMMSDVPPTFEMDPRDQFAERQQQQEAYWQVSNYVRWLVMPNESESSRITLALQTYPKLVKRGQEAIVTLHETIRGGSTVRDADLDPVTAFEIRYLDDRITNNLTQEEIHKKYASDFIEFYGNLQERDIDRVLLDRERERVRKDPHLKDLFFGDWLDQTQPRDPIIPKTVFQLKFSLPTDSPPPPSASDNA